MTNAPPSVIVTLPARTAADARREIEEAAIDRADGAEIRVDRWSPAERAGALGLFPSPLPLWATYRSTAEGGEGFDEPAVRAHELAALAELPFARIDLELERDLPLQAELARVLHRPGAPGLVVSRHLPHGTSAEALRATTAADVPAGALRKVVFEAGVAELVTQFWSELPRPADGPFVIHSTGASAELLRALGRSLGMASVFASPGSDRVRAPVQAGQIPVDLLADYFHHEPPGPLFALVGHPLRHSRSPALHARWMKRADLSGLYLRLEIAQAHDLAATLVRLPGLGFRGLNVTLPLKIPALALATEASPAAERAGCANTLTFTGEEIQAENTDVPAFDRRLGELRRHDSVAADRVTVLGAGGAARAALTVVSGQGLEAEVLARDPAAAGALAREFGAELRRPETRRPAQLLVHATPAGSEEMPGLDVPLRPLLGPGTYVVDYVVAPHHRFLEQEARARGGRYEDGGRLLEYQAAESFAIWWGRPPPES